MGCGRLEGQASTETLARLYAAARVHVNLFQPSFKLREKTRVGAQGSRMNLWRDDLLHEVVVPRGAFAFGLEAAS